MEENSQYLQRAVAKILSVLELPSLETFTDQNREISQVVSPKSVAERLQATIEPRLSRTAAMAMTREHSLEPEPSKIDDTLVSAPMGSLYEVTRLRNLRSNPNAKSGPRVVEDFISKGKVSEAEAEELFHIFSTSLNHYLWGGIALVHENLASVRQSSSLLLAAILSVTALHIPGRGKTFDVCYAELIALVCDSMFERYHVLDGIRGLCIGAFWLSDVSWKLSGHAVRIATELNLHQSYSRAIRGSQEHIEGARLWYFLYVCDHHFSIAYGRPPVIHENEIITHHERFLELPTITQADLRLHSQVALFLILTRVYNTFGADIQQTLSEESLVRLRHFNIDLDSWRIKWEPLLAPNRYVLSYPAKGVILHLNFGKLQVGALALRGMTHPSDLIPDRRELVGTAINCAMGILQMVLEDMDVRTSVVGVPIYLSTMITYSAVFLLKVHQKWGYFKIGTDPVLVRDLVTRIITLLTEVRAGERHLTGHIAVGLTKMLDRFTAWEEHEQSHAQHIPESRQGRDQTDQTGYDYPVDYSSFAWSGSELPFYDKNYLPIGFFDVLAPTFDVGNGDHR
ncbi:related to C6 transcription factor [Rhynchosporium graminicola]|uniref:Related to C6 transcription factor n=1 Tax=Rhynchosporium graminicola TaxID=2792576 RepID=A0A1E1K2F0_9HELO|nr:related to C6 transcription factor [Rhynchosporium commune]